jgi:hypothetical protein
MNPLHRMPDPETAWKRAVLNDAMNALCVARCSAQLAGYETQEFVVRELLVTVIQQVDRAAATLRRLP